MISLVAQEDEYSGMVKNSGFQLPRVDSRSVMAHSSQARGEFNKEMFFLTRGLGRV